MYKELSIHKNDLIITDVQNKVLDAVGICIGGISALSYFLPYITDIVPDKVNLIVPIDYPFGTSTTKLRQHATIAAIRKGANTIDLILNTLDIVNENYSEIIKDLESHIRICGERKAKLRIILEYRVLTKQKLYRVCGIIEERGIECVLPSTGFMVDECADNLIVSLELQKKFGFEVITNGNLWLSSQYDIVKQSGVYGVRLNNKNINLIQNGVL